MAEQAVVKYDTEHGKVQLSPDIIRKYLVSGDSAKVTHQEVMMFLQLCQYQKLNPFLREAYLIKFGTEPATIVTGKEVFTKRGAASKACAGWDAGIIVKTDQGMEHRDGTFMMPDENLVGGWAKVYRKDWQVPLSMTASLSEYKRLRKDGQPMANWKSMPATMIRKVALVQALREAFPEDLEGMVSMEEMPVDESLLSGEPVKAEIIDVSPPQKESSEENKSTKKITKPQAKRLFAIGSGNEDLIREVMGEFGYESTSDIYVTDYDDICSKVEKKVQEAVTEPEVGDDGLTEEQRKELDEQTGEQEGIFK